MSDPTREKHRRLVEALYKRTLDGKLIWETSSGASGYDAFVGSKIINIQEHDTEFDEKDYFIRILSQTFSVVDEFSDTDISIHNDPPIGFDFRNHYLLMGALYKRALRIATGAEQAIDEILGELAD